MWFCFIVYEFHLGGADKDRVPVTAVSSTQAISNTLWCLDGLIPADQIQFYCDSNNAHRHI